MVGIERRDMCQLTSMDMMAGPYVGCKRCLDTASVGGFHKFDANHEIGPELKTPRSGKLRGV